MLRSIQQRDLDRNRWIKISMAVILGLIIVSMVVTLVPGLMSGPDATSPETIASVGGRNVTVVDFQRQFDQATRNQAIPPMMRGFYAKQLLNDMIFQRALEYEAQRMGIRVTPEEEAERIKEILPTAWSGNTWLKDRYTSEVETRTGMSVEQFESVLRDEMLVQKFHQLVTDAITVSPAEIEQQFRWRNEKVKIEYAVIKPADLASSIHPTDADLSAWFAKNSSRYQIPEKRSARYALLDLAKVRESIHVNDDTLRAYYNAHIDEYKVQNRVHVEHILFKTVGKTDAEIAEIRQQALAVLKQANHGANFEDLAKRYSEDDGTKPKGGDLGWIVEGQTVPEFQKAAFSLPKGTISDLVKTQYGFHIIKVLDRETAHTKSFEEVRESILQRVLAQKATTEANDLEDQMASAVRQSDRQPLEDLAKRFHLELGETPPAAITDPLGYLSNSPDLQQMLFRLQPGELSRPIQTDSGYVILTVKDVLPAHPGELAEVHDRVLADYQREKSIDLARTRAEELSKRAEGGEALEKAAKALDLAVKTSDSFSRTGSIPDVGTGRQVDAAFNMAVGQVSKPTQVGDNWLVYRVVSHDAPNPVDLAKQEDAIKQQILQTKKDAAFEAFHTALVDRLKQEGKLTINSEAMKRVTRSS
ncbi:MAG TPA: peptidyl-prolyl cis-trans isomerase [Candidatus Polarisedimenticolia bacterium]|nr:peptidyl-prolyl cis-trans isomerase [Candidatus Polarisedimenticolia bacterium]